MYVAEHAEVCTLIQILEDLKPSSKIFQAIIPGFRWVISAKLLETKNSQASVPLKKRYKRLKQCTFIYAHAAGLLLCSGNIQHALKQMADVAAIKGVIVLL
jgi:hypothetical protein